MFSFSERHLRKNQRKAFIHTLTAYGFGPLGGIGGPPLDRFGNLSDVPDGFADGAGVFDLTVAPVAGAQRSCDYQPCGIVLSSLSFQRGVECDRYRTPRPKIICALVYGVQLSPTPLRRIRAGRRGERRLKDEG